MSTTTTTTAQQTQAKIFVFDFDSRDTYLAWRSNWRAQYKILSKEIRALKANIAKMQKEGGYTGSEQAHLVSLRHQAREMIEERIASKIEAGRQMNVSA